LFFLNAFLLHHYERTVAPAHKNLRTHTLWHSLSRRINSQQLLPWHLVQTCVRRREVWSKITWSRWRRTCHGYRLTPFVGNLTRLMSNEECRSPIGLDCCSCCLDLANGCEPEPGQASLGSPTSINHFKQLRDQLHFQNLNTDKLNNIMRQDSLESVVRDPCYLLNEGICNSNIDQTMLSILLFFHRYVTKHHMHHTPALAHTSTSGHKNRKSLCQSFDCWLMTNVRMF